MKLELWRNYDSLLRFGPLLYTFPCHQGMPAILLFLIYSKCTNWDKRQKVTDTFLTIEARERLENMPSFQVLLYSSIICCKASQCSISECLWTWEDSCLLATEIAGQDYGKAYSFNHTYEPCWSREARWWQIFSWQQTFVLCSGQRSPPSHNRTIHALFCGITIHSLTPCFFGTSSTPSPVSLPIIVLVPS